MKVLHLRTGCRLHFGLMELAADEPLRYAGLGLMLAQPGFELSFTGPPAAEDYSAEGCSPGDFRTAAAVDIAAIVDASGVALPAGSPPSDGAELRQEYQRRMAAVVKQHPVFDRSTTATQLPKCQIRLLNALPMHSGLGAGTQLACGVAAGLELFARGRQFNRPTEAWTSAEHARNSSQAANAQRWSSVLAAQPPISTQWLTQATGRGLRSAIGLFGFLDGGLILDQGYTVDSSPDVAAQDESCQGVRPLAGHSTRVAPAWRVVLIVPQHRQEVSGAQETQWMAELGLLPNPHRNDMLSLAQKAFSLALDERKFIDFTHCLEQYMELAGQLFSRFQGGLYNGQDVATAVRSARRIGLRGVGQSSWGPTVFGFAESPAMAQHYAAQLSDMHPNWSVRVATPATHAAEYRWQ